MARRALGPATLALTRAVAALPEAPWLVACSGGADSLALAWAAHHVAGRRGTPVRAVAVDHGLRAGSDVVAAAVVARLAGFGLDAVAARVAVAGEGNVEAAARASRYAALEERAAPEEAILLGHTLDDQAETVLLGLARGSGPRSLAGMAPVRGRLLRPLLGLTRADTAAACAELGLEPWQDPMNEDPRFARVRVRTAVLPLLERELGPGIAAALARTADLCRDAADAVDDLAAPLASVPEPACADLAAATAGVRRAGLRAWLAARGATDLSARHVEAVEALVTRWRGQRGVDVPGGRVTRSGTRLRFHPRGGEGNPGRVAPQSPGMPRVRPARRDSLSRWMQRRSAPSSPRSSTPTTRSRSGSPSWPPRSTRSTGARTCS
ncbi:tRNA lysidine(34) synthetase TilS [Propioniciclava coleopterorum]|uniref:tRNA lysidine(34) synthetase TilS n=1 Tax=Propioniciclava coleopterorum TaxID=2714937 RepID=UPI00140C429B|nr:tRNA lysidine(34) synthetase TilS [Propioniciclava coleopterorum]